MSSSMNRNPFSQPPDNNKDGKKDVFNLTEDGQKVSTQQSFSTFTSQDEPDFTEVLSKRNAASSVLSRKLQGDSHFQTFSPNDSSNDQQDETSMNLDNNKTDNQNLPDII
ncbi:unnamed protein product [Rhizophagus irregularis]|nr:unnamed protein product [Rhizophagus irregularis]